jgi:hypothetical protein
MARPGKGRRSFALITVFPEQAGQPNRRDHRRLSTGLPAKRVRERFFMNYSS